LAEPEPQEAPAILALLRDEGNSMPDENDVKFLRDHAGKCRWLAGQSNDPQTARKLHDMARDYEAQATALEKGEQPEAE